MSVPRLQKRVSRGSTSEREKDAPEARTVAGGERADLGMGWIVRDREGRHDGEEVTRGFGGGRVRRTTGMARGEAGGIALRGGDARRGVAVVFERFRLNSVLRVILRSRAVFTLHAVLAAASSRAVHRVRSTGVNPVQSKPPFCEISLLAILSLDFFSILSYQRQIDREDASIVANRPAKRFA